MRIQNDISWLLPYYQRLQHLTVQLSLANQNILFFISACVNSTAKLTISYCLFYFLILIFSLVN